jgi:hypothetical protein
LGPEPRRLITGDLSGHLGDSRLFWNAAPLQPLPLVASRLGGEWRGQATGVELTEIRQRELLERLPRPLSLAGDPDAFAFTIVGSSMWPRFRPGARVAVSPRAPVTIGDDVLARLRTSPGAEQSGVEQALVMHLVRRTARAFELRQFNPDKTIDIDAGEVEAILKIAGELI